MGAVIALALGSCAYDPYYPAGVAYGAGYGYGGGDFSTAMFVSTGDPRWGYDPYSYCYYDYTRRCYYDPYLYGYYPMGYRPMVVVGVPHPHGYSRTFCPPPHRVLNVTLANYHNREYAYRNSSYSWARQIPPNSGSYRGQSPVLQSPYSHGGNINNPGNRGPGPVSYPRMGSTYNNGAVNRSNPQVYSKPLQGDGRSHYNTPMGGSQMNVQHAPNQPRTMGSAGPRTALQGHAVPASQGSGHNGKGRGGDVGKENKDHSNR